MVSKIWPPSDHFSFVILDLEIFYCYTPLIYGPSHKFMMIRWRFPLDHFLWNPLSILPNHVGSFSTLSSSKEAKGLIFSGKLSINLGWALHGWVRWIEDSLDNIIQGKLLHPIIIIVVRWVIKNQYRSNQISKAQNYKAKMINEDQILLIDVIGTSKLCTQPNQMCMLYLKF